MSSDPAPPSPNPENDMKIAANEVHLWYARDEEISDGMLLAKYHDLLNEEERIQHKRFYFEKHRHQYLVTRALLRSVLSLYVDAIPPEAWCFEKNRYNKPYIKNFPLPLALNFNLSHTEKMSVLGVALYRELGVDVEFLPRRNAGLDLAKRYFSAAEFQDLCSMPAAQQTRRFFDLWTLKEAYIKACGMGLAIPLDHFSYSFPRPGEIQIAFGADRNDHPNNWSLWQIKPDESHIVGLAVHDSGTGGPYDVTMREIVPLQSIKDVRYPIITRSLPRQPSYA
jgi:4'-phosphopantetheinyl transferase